MARLARMTPLVVALGCLPIDEVNRDEYDALLARMEAMENATVTSSQVGDDAITSAHLALNSVRTQHVANGTLTSDDLAADACASTQIADDAIVTAKLANNAVTGTKLADSSVTANKLAVDSVGSSELLSGSVSSSEVLDNSLQSADITDALSLGSANVADGFLSIFSQTGPFAATFMSHYEDSLGYIATQYVNSGNEGAVFATSASSSMGYVGVNGDDSTCCEAGMYVDSSGNGIVFGDTKSFVVPHPFAPDLRVVYASIEGPEAAAYVRGRSTLVDGFAVVDLPEHFRWVVAADGLTVQVTPMGRDSLGLAVTDVTPEYILVEELDGGSGTYDFFWRVEGVRLGHEDFSPIRPAAEFAPQLPSYR